MAQMSRTVHRLLAFALVLLALGCGGSGDEASASFEIDGAVATMSGVIDSTTPDAVQDLLDDHPNVTTISLANVPGSADDEANLSASRLVRSVGLATHVPSDGQIASGGVDFFLAGASRSFDDGARFGVHSWATGDGTEGIDVAADDPQHRLYLDYYAEVGIDDAFYWFTLNAAPANDIHWMTLAELETHGFATP